MRQCKKICAKIASPLLKSVIGLELVSLAACVDAEYIYSFNQAFKHKDLI